MSAPNPANPQMGGAPPKKTSPIVWILVAVAGLVVVFGLLMVAGGLFIFSKAKQAGFDPGLMRENPALAVTKMITAMDPNVDVVGVDEDRGLITLRDKESGKTVTVNFEDVKKGKISFESEEGEKMTLEAAGEGEEGSFRMKSSEGTFEFGTAASGKLPGWLPVYPGAEMEAIMSHDTPEERGGNAAFTTGDSVERVMNFYARGLERAGMEVSTTQHTGLDSGAMVNAHSADSNRRALVIIGTGEEGTTVNISFGDTK